MIERPFVLSNKMSQDTVPENKAKMMANVNVSSVHDSGSVL